MSFNLFYLDFVLIVYLCSFKCVIVFTIELICYTFKYSFNEFLLFYFYPILVFVMYQVELNKNEKCCLGMYSV